MHAHDPQTMLEVGHEVGQPCFAWDLPRRELLESFI